MVIYFTGTGNSRFLANRLAAQLGDEVVDAAACLKKMEFPTYTSETPYVFVSPTYAWRLPRVFEAWLFSCSFTGNRKAYYVLNCGSEIGAADEYLQKNSAGLGLEHMGTARVVMPENYIALFSAPSKAKADKILAAARPQTDALARDIRAGKAFDPVKITPIGRLCSGPVNKLFYNHILGAKKFTVSDACTGCGKCVSGCMLNNITLCDGKPVWDRNCTHCMACICGCPTQAIDYGRHSKGLRRYTCPEEE